MKGKEGRRKVPKAFSKKLILTKEQIYCIILTAILAVLSISVQKEGVLRDGNIITRSEPGGADKKYELRLGGLGTEDETISVKVSSREYTEEEAGILFEELMENLAVHIVGSNENLDWIDTDLEFPKSVKGYEGIRLSYYPLDTSLIGYDGQVHNDGLSEETETSLRVVLSTGTNREEYVLPVTVAPRKRDSIDELKDLLSSLIEEADREQIETDTLVLPESLNGMSISYSEIKDWKTLKIVLGGIFAAALVGLRPEQERRKKEKERERELLCDYSDMVSRLIVYMGAGLSVRNAWLKLAENYESELEAGLTERRAVYDEMLISAGELRKGVPEARVYGEFARRCRQRCYLKLASILEQNVRNGDARSEAALLLEMQEAFEERKNIARRLGEEAGTKLMLPLMLSLGSVLVITAAPALISLG